MKFDLRAHSHIANNLMWQIAPCERICPIYLRRRDKDINWMFLALAVLLFPAKSPKISPPLTLKQVQHLHFGRGHRAGFVCLFPSAKIEVTIYDVLFASKKTKDRIFQENTKVDIMLSCTTVNTFCSLLRCIINFRWLQISASCIC